MGDRGNIIIEADGEVFPAALYLYTHWSGSRIPALLREGLTKGRDRWNDPQYLARVLFQTLIGKDTGVASFGLSTAKGDGGTEYYVNMKAQTVRAEGAAPLSFGSFVSQPQDREEDESE